MLLFKVVFAVVALFIGLIVFDNIYGDNVFFSAVRSKVSTVHGQSFSKENVTYDDNCLPQEYMGNKYFEIKIPSGFCGCLNDGKKALIQSKAMGEDLSQESFTSMCVDVYYKAPFLVQCKKINSMLLKANKTRRLNCVCFAQRVNSLFSRAISSDFDMEMPEDVDNILLNSNDINSGLERLQDSMDIGGEKTSRPIYSIPASVVTSCMKQVSEKR
ncbi:MAG: hypothetical protein COA45_11175 [Zetaproteobacteria bacterium]|nr:MAG: hypothetical protein COA45_11175 [Zetaproteobacteria bacterium]